MIRKKVLGIGTSSATLLVQDTEANGELRVLRRINVSGWAQRDAQATCDLYNLLCKDNLPGFVHIHTVLVQSGFLNIVTSFCAGGDLATYLEDELTSPLEEKHALTWVLVLAQAVQQLHRVSRVPFHGPTLNHVYMDSASGAAGILAGLPLSAHVYLKTVAERRAEGVAVEREYPPEVLQSRRYHPTLSDVWHLGCAGMRLLSAHGQLSQRSTTARQLMARMTDPSLTKRIPLDDAVSALRSVVGDVLLSPPLPRVAPSHNSAATMAAASAKATAAPVLNTSGTPGRTGGGCSSTTGTSVASLTAMIPQASAPPASTTSSPPEVPLTAPNRNTSIADNNNSNIDNIGGNTSGGVAKRRTAAASGETGGRTTSPRRGPAAPRGQRTLPHDSWHRRAEEQFAELQRMNASPPMQRHLSRPGSPRGGIGGEDGEESPERNRRHSAFPLSHGQPLLLYQQQQLNTSQLRRRSGSAGLQPGSGRTSQMLDNNTKALNEMFAEREAQQAKQERLQSELEWRRQRHAMQERRASEQYTQHQANLRHIRDDGPTVRQQEIRKHLKEWSARQNDELANGYGDNVVVMANSNVTILAPRPAPPAHAPSGDHHQDPSISQASSGGGGKGTAIKGKAGQRSGAGRGSSPPVVRNGTDSDDADLLIPDHNKHVSVTILMPKNPPPLPSQPPLPSVPGTAAAMKGPGAIPSAPPAERAHLPSPALVEDGGCTGASAISSPGYATPRDVADSSVIVSGGAGDVPADATRDSSPAPCDPPPPHGRVPTPDLHHRLRQVPQDPPQRCAPLTGPAPQVPPSIYQPAPLLPLPVRHQEGITTNSNANYGRPSSAEPSTGGSGAARDADTMGALEWTIDGVRSAVRTLLGNRAIYGEAMMAVAEFVSRGEEARMEPRQNDQFMIHLKSLIVDNRVFGAAAPLCVQLVALEGLYQTVRENRERGRLGSLRQVW